MAAVDDVPVAAEIVGVVDCVVGEVADAMEAAEVVDDEIANETTFVTMICNRSKARKKLTFDLRKMFL